MIPHKRNIGSLQDIRTHSGKVDSLSLPYKSYMRLSCLEMEKARRGIERDSAMFRLKNIDDRLLEIEAEKAVLLLALKQIKIEKSINASEDEPKPALGRSIKGFKIKY